jgi:hypothetical protein
MRGIFFDSCHCSLVIHFEQSRIRVKFLEDSADTVSIWYTVDSRHYTPIRVFGSSSCTTCRQRLKTHNMSTLSSTTWYQVPELVRTIIKLADKYQVVVAIGFFSNRFCAILCWRTGVIFCMAPTSGIARQQQKLAQHIPLLLPVVPFVAHGLSLQLPSTGTSSTII